MSESRNLHHYDYPGTIEGACYLLTQCELADLNINLGKDNVAIYLMHMSDLQTWKHYKASIEEAIENMEGEANASPGEKREWLARNVRLNVQKNNAKKIDQLIQNGNLQTLLISEEVLKRNYPKYLKLLDQYHKEEKNLTETREKLIQATSKGQVENFDDEINRLEKLVANFSDLLKEACEEDLKLKQLVNTIEWLRQRESLAYLHLESIKPVQIEGGAETFSSADDVVIQALDYTKQFDVVDHSKTLSGIPTADSWIDVVRTIPVVNDLIRGVIYLWEALEALDNRDAPQRTAKIAAGFTGGLISIATSIVGALLLGGVGLLATAAAAYAAPIAIAAATVGVYCITLVRDTHVLYEGYKQLQRNEVKLREINFALENPNTSALDFAHQSLQKANLIYATTELRRACDIARKKVILSAICVAALSLTLAAVCLTGVGALVLGALGGSVLLGTTIARVYLSRKEKQKRVAKMAKQATSAQGEDSVSVSASKIHEVKLSNTGKKPALANHKHDVVDIEERLLGSREAAKNALKEMASDSQSNNADYLKSTHSEKEGTGKSAKVASLLTDIDDDSEDHTFNRHTGG